MIVSVPYWGSLSSNFVNDVPKTLKDFKFPSPTGVLYLLIAEKKLSSHSDELEFPSPTGVLYLLIFTNENAAKYADYGFRPLLGFSIF